MQEKYSTTTDRLERLRQKLLDLTTNNRMLSYRHPRASCLRVIDELPGVLFQAMQDGQSLTFEPVPEPSRRDLENWSNQNPSQVPRAGEPSEIKKPDGATWARHLGFHVNFALPVEVDSFERSDRHADKKIQTVHYADELDARLRKIRAAGRTAIEESGANMLYAAFGFLEWRDSNSAKAHQAPLVMMPVELDREVVRGGQYRTKIRWTNEDIQPNLSLKKKLEEFNIALPELEEEQSLEEFFTKVARAVKDKPDWIVRRYVTLGLFEFGKILLYLDLDPQRWPSNGKIQDHPLVKHILEGGQNNGAEERHTGFGGTEEDLTPSAIASRDLTLELVDRADSSQCEALDVALAGRNLVIEGPPGTGKSQTITNLVAAALARGKTVLFVAEKLAALEVVRRRMRELGLGEFCLELHSHKTRKTELLEDIADRIRLSANTRSSRLIESALARLESKRQSLTDYIDIVSGQAGAFDGLYVSEALMQAGRARRKLGAEVKNIEREVEGMISPENMKWAEFKDAKARIKLFQDAFRSLNVTGSAYTHPWAGISAASVLPHDTDRIVSLSENWANTAQSLAAQLEKIDLQTVSSQELTRTEEGLVTLDLLLEHFETVENVANMVEDRLGLKVNRSANGIAKLVSIVEACCAAPVQNLGSRNPYCMSKGVSTWLKEHAARLARLNTNKDDCFKVFKESASLSNLDDLEEWAAALGQRSLFSRIGKRWKVASASWTSLARPAYLSAKPLERARLFLNLRQLLQDTRSLIDDQEVAVKLGKEAAKLDYDTAPLIEVAEWTDRVRSSLPPELSEKLLNGSSEALAKIANLEMGQSESFARLMKSSFLNDGTTFWDSSLRSLLPKELVNLASRAGMGGAWKELLVGIRACVQNYELLEQAEKSFKEATDYDHSRWFNGTKPGHNEVATRAARAAEHGSALPKWLDFDRIRQLSSSRSENSLVDAAARGTINLDVLETSFDFLVFDSLARMAFKQSPSLLSISGKSMDALRAEYRALDGEVMELRRAAIAAKLVERRPPAGRQTGLKSDLTEMALIRSELSKQRRHIPLRQLVTRAGKSLQALKPCFMMGPLSVAQYIAPGNLNFDLVIMDEASQMRPEEAIGALARGGQAIVVGDPKQLPPTSFFDRIAENSGDDDSDDEITLAEDSKSILELAESIFDRRILRWHYRSRHEALIAFSNREFYKDQLIVFPSPAGQASRYGIGWNFVSDGVANKGVNPAEARRVAEAAATILVEQKGRSLGVVAMNVKQAQRISDELSDLANKNRELAEALAKSETDLRGEPFFVKNLENVQGDERDIIMISMTYGPPTPGVKTPQNFGPINQETGWRRLNVLFTRAKERMEIFSSMRSMDVLPKEGGDRGPRSLKLFLNYAETGKLGVDPVIGVRPTGSDFEDAVLEGLAELGYECVPQLGVANYFLDIGVRDPGAPEEFIAAIECDGATYHSEKSARDRDRLRQEHLENLGWSIIRVWSTDWFRGPQNEIERVSSELKRLIQRRQELRERPRVHPEKAEEGQLGIIQTGRVDGKSAVVDPQPVEKSQKISKIRGLTLDQARAELIDLRENVIKKENPEADLTRGFLRKTLLDELLRKRPSDLDEFRSSIRLDLREATDAQQLKKFHEQVFDILSKVDATN